MLDTSGEIARGDIVENRSFVCPWERRARINGRAPLETGEEKRQGGEKICRVLQVTKAERRNIALYNKMRISFDKSVGKVELCNFRTLRRPCHGTALFRDAFQS